MNDHFEQSADSRGTYATVRMTQLPWLDSRSTSPIFTDGTIVAGRYRVVRLLGRGGMGEVYLAFDHLLEEQVALKTLASPGLLDEAALSDAFWEVRLARGIAHPNVCRVYDVGVHASDERTHFMTMEFIEGFSLRSRIMRGRAPLAEAVDCARQLLQGLSAVHAAGVIHRDLKVDNVLIRRNADSAATVVITDFGCACSLRQSESSVPLDCRGSYAYMAPEQLLSGTVSPETDLYSFGLIVYELLTGQLPFAEHSPTTRVLRRLQETPMRPGLLRVDIPSWLDDYVLRCLRLTPSERFGTAQAALGALNEVVRSHDPTAQLEL